VIPSSSSSSNNNNKMMNLYFCLTTHLTSILNKHPSSSSSIGTLSSLGLGVLGSCFMYTSPTIFGSTAKLQSSPVGSSSSVSSSNVVLVVVLGAGVTGITQWVNKRRRKRGN